MSNDMAREKLKIFCLLYFFFVGCDDEFLTAYNSRVCLMIEILLKHTTK